jgi:hypothetical protein
MEPFLITLTRKQEIQLKSLMLILVLLQSSFVLSAETTQTTTTTTTTETAQPTPPSTATTRVKAVRTTSAEEREAKKFQIAFGMLGHEYVGFSALTAHLGFFLDPDNILFARYSNLNGRGLDDEDSAKLRAVTVGVRHFVGNSFNLTPTIYYKRTVEDGDYSLFTSQRSRRVYEDLGLGFRIGNEWQWDSFMMGCDWFGVNRTIKKFNSEKTNDSWDDLSSDGRFSFIISSFYVGFSF